MMDYLGEIEKTAKVNFFYHASPVQAIKKLRLGPDTSGHGHGKVVFASPCPKMSAAFGLKWDGNNVKFEEKFLKNSPKDYKHYDHSILRIKDKNLDLDAPASMYKLKGDFVPLGEKGKDIEYVGKNVKIVEEKRFDSYLDMAKKYGVEIDKSKARNIKHKSSVSHVNK